jgi:hypothetical protein
MCVVQITRCDLSGLHCTTVVSMEASRPSDVAADPYNGYVLLVYANLEYSITISLLTTKIRHDMN